jgi:hypothetical protein
MKEGENTNSWYLTLFIYNGVINIYSLSSFNSIYLLNKPSYYNLLINNLVANNLTNLGKTYLENK